MSSHRALRIRALLKREISEILRREYSVQQNGLITVTDVDISGDLRLATVYVGILGSPHQQQEGLAVLQRDRVRIQSFIAQNVILKYTPQLRFVMDTSVERGNRVLQILDELDNPSSPPSAE